jgi:predicted deacetylase
VTKMSKLPKPAQYLLRIDDLCPTVHARRWDCIRLLIEEFGIRPILAVVPANKDPELEVSAPDPRFWIQMRAMEAAGAVIALHGYSHLCITRGKSLLPLHSTSEFTGLALDFQRSRIARGLQILRSHGLAPKLWVAPRHSFDLNTLAALRDQGIHYLSDGLARMPFQRGGVTWIPMQLWSPASRSRGLWTICIHPNTTNRARFEELRRFVRRHSDRFTSFDDVLAKFNTAPLNPYERLYEIIATGRLLLHLSLVRLGERDGAYRRSPSMHNAEPQDSAPANRKRGVPTYPARPRR